MERGTKIAAIAAVGFALATALGGCATTGTATTGIEIRRGGGSDRVKAATPGEVYASFADGSPAPHVRIRAMDTSERVYDVTTDDAGRAPLALWSEAIALWRVQAPDGRYVPIQPCRIYAADGKIKGFRFACTIPEGGSK